LTRHRTLKDAAAPGLTEICHQKDEPVIFRGAVLTDIISKLVCIKVGPENISTPIKGRPTQNNFDNFRFNLILGKKSQQEKWVLRSKELRDQFGL